MDCQNEKEKKMEKDCCNIKITEIENGYNIQVTGDKVKECCEVAMKEKDGCCTDQKKEESK